MKRNLWGFLLAGVLAMSAVAATTVTASAAPATPTVSASFNGTGVRVSWSFTSANRAKGRVVEIEKRPDQGDAFAKVVTRTNAPSTANFVDKAITTRYVTYRARVIENGTTGAWGMSETVDTYPRLPAGTWACPSGWEANAIAYINQLRAQVNHPALTADIRLMRATRLRAGKFAARGAGTHAGNSADAKKFGFKAPVAENISTGGDWKSTVDGWMASPAGHRTTLLNGIAYVGIGCAMSAVGFATVPYWSLLTYYNGNMLFPS